jgi:DNA repair protein RadC
MQSLRSQDLAEYKVLQQESVLPAVDAARESAIIAEALSILEGRMRKNAVLLSSPADCKKFLQLKLAPLPHEVFSVLFLDTQNRLIAFEEMFRGTLNQTSVYPREVVLSALRHNASAVVLSHNHPSGNPEPSRADEALTQTLKAALALVDVRVLDHIVVCADSCTSMAEKGMV